MSLRYRAAALWTLFKHYKAVFAHFWPQRHTMKGGLFNEEEAEFLPAALSLQEKPLSTTAKWTGRFLIALVVIGLIWSLLGRIDIIVNATGKVVPSGRTKTIASVDVASVRALHVIEGQVVKQGDVLVELDSSAYDTERDKANGDRAVALLQQARSKAMVIAVDTLKAPHLVSIDNIPPEKIRSEQAHLNGQFHDFMAKLARLDGDIQRFHEALMLATRTAKDYLELSLDHDVSTHAYLEKEQARIELERQLSDARHERTSLIAQTRKEAQDAFTDAGKMAESSQQDALRADTHGKLLKLTAPVDGTVQQLTAFTIGGVVPAAQPIMQIVPVNKSIEIEAFLENKDIGFVLEGQPVSVKVDAFDYTKYGTVDGYVTHVSRDAIQDEKKGLIYSVKVTLDRADIDVDGKRMDLSAGLSVNVDIKTGTRRVIEYVLSPLMQYGHESLRER